MVSTHWSILVTSSLSGEGEAEEEEGEEGDEDDCSHWNLAE